MDSLEYALIVILCINLMLVLGTFSAEKINPGLPYGSMVDCERSPLGQYASENCTKTKHYSIDTGSPTLPTSSTSVDATTGSVFTDTWNTIKGFFADTLGLKYVVAIVGAPASFLKGMGLDPDFSALIGGVWWIITTLLIITYIKR
jgi:hypothetical protein